MESQNVSAQINYLRNIPRHTAELSTRTYKGKLSSARAEFQILAEKNKIKKTVRAVALFAAGFE